MSNEDPYDKLFDEKDPAEEWLLGFDFGDYPSPISLATFTITRLSGPTDSNPNAMKIGSPLTQGTGRAVHLIGGGVDGCDYAIRCEATVNGEKLVLVGLLPVRKKKAR